MIFTHMRESRYLDKRRRIVFFQEEYPSVKIGHYWTSLVVEVSEGHHHGEIIDNEIYELVNVDVEVRLVRGCGPSFCKTYED